MTKCSHCKETIFIAANGFSGIPKKKFCAKCWLKIHTIWNAERYYEQDPTLWDWTHMIKLDE